MSRAFFLFSPAESLDVPVWEGHLPVDVSF
jgi:hypothetical protein